MDPLATLDDLKAYRIDYDDDQLAQRLLESVSASIRDAAGSPISWGEWTFTIPSEQSRKLDLPIRPVHQVATVLVDGQPVEDWRLFGNALYRPRPWGAYGQIPVPVTITCTAGYKPIPEDIVRLACSYVAAGLHQQAEGGPGANKGVAYRRIDDYQIGYVQTDTADQVDVMELTPATKRSLRARFGTPAIGIGVFR